jgi:hypothetical protein
MIAFVLTVQAAAQQEETIRVETALVSVRSSSATATDATSRDYSGMIFC